MSNESIRPIPGNGSGDAAESRGGATCRTREAARRSVGRAPGLRSGHPGGQTVQGQGAGEEGLPRNGQVSGGHVSDAVITRGERNSFSSMWNPRCFSALGTIPSMNPYSDDCWNDAMR